MKLEIEIKVGKTIGYSNVVQVSQKKEFEMEELGCVKTARNAIDRVVEEFLLDLKTVQVKAENALEKEEEEKKKKAGLDF